MFNTLCGIKAVHNTVKHLSGFFGCSKEFAKLYHQAATPQECMVIAQRQAALLVNDIG